MVPQKPNENKDRRLIDEHVLIVSPTLAQAVGLNEAIILQQIHYWLHIAEENKNNFREGYYWTFNSITQWQEQFPFWHKDTVMRTINKLRRDGILITGRFNRKGYDRTTWYRIDYERLQALVPANFANCINACMQNTQMDYSKMRAPIPETSSNNSNNISSREFSKENPQSGTAKPPHTISFYEFKQLNTVDRDVATAIEYFLATYWEAVGKEHMKLTAQTWEQVADTFINFYEDGSFIDELHFENIVSMTNHYFNKFKAGKYKAKNASITHFNNEGIKKVNFYEACYYGDDVNVEDLPM